MTGRALADVHGELEALVGRQGPPIRGAVGRSDIERYATAAGDPSPVYRSHDAAREAGYDGVPSPPVMLTSIIEWNGGPPLAELRRDGTGVGRESWLPLDGLRLMGGGQDLVFHAPVLAGSDVEARPTLERVELKTGGAGSMVLMTITTEYRDPDGASLVTCRETLIAR